MKQLTVKLDTIEGEKISRSQADIEIKGEHISEGMKFMVDRAKNEAKSKK